MIDNRVREKLELFLYLIQSLKIENKTDMQIRDSFLEYGLDDQEWYDLWEIYTALEQHWREAIQKLFLHGGIFDDEIQQQLKGLSEPLFRQLCLEEKQKIQEEMQKNQPRPSYFLWKMAGVYGICIFFAIAFLWFFIF
ncbi:hypothetical protein CCZ01_01260 [Helicobacter monodelphidis]|uniref:hypothetical protein n=1 Tax=Helicobacter sp. 15-1451 TaxID=2004995 RepID=UPI000DCCEF54|nr:hypothetical protein [Helicobacter sp. 15-1451]RAX58852.1 hypothetical protein CCZ01_01260 [Helicobacter sp. 15-1451]